MNTLTRISSEACALLGVLPEREESFLQFWTQHMEQAGYLLFTTARRSDCVTALNWYLKAILGVMDHNALPSFAALMEHGEWAQAMLESAHRHRVRGVTATMFVGCFKTFIYALEDVLHDEPGSDRAKAEATHCLRRFGDAFEVLLIDQWGKMNARDALQELDDRNRQLVLEKCRYENILSSISDLVFTLDEEGRIMEANRRACDRLASQDLLGTPIWTHFSMGVDNVGDFLDSFAFDQSYPVKGLAAHAREVSYDMIITELHEVSLASNAYLVVFSDVSSHSQQKDELEGIVAQRTDLLAQEKQRLQEMNVTLENVLQTIERQKQEQAALQLRTLDEQIFPVLRRLRMERSLEARDAYFDLLEKQLGKLCEETHENDRPVLSAKLTPAEALVCQMLREGLPSKVIAQAMNISVETIHTHRKNIRKKLGLRGRGKSIFNYFNDAGQA